MKTRIKTFILLALSGLLWSLANPSAPPLITKTANFIINTGYQEVFAWFGLIPFLFAMKSKSGWRAFITAFMFSAVYLGVSQYWITIALVEFGNIPTPLSIAIYLLLIIELGLQWALSIFIGYSVHRRLGHHLSISLPITMVVGELFRNYFVFSGHPWSNIAYSQYLNLPVLQSASIWGIYGINYMIVLSNVVLFELYLWHSKRDDALFPRAGLVILIAMLAFSFGYGTYRLDANDKLENQAPTIKAAMIQGNIHQDLKNFSNVHARNIISVYKGLSRQVPADVDLLIWPEAAFPYNLPHDTPSFERVFAGDYSKLPWPLLTGVSTYTGLAKNRKYFNSVFLVDRDMAVIDRADKSHLVPFGEYVPFREILSVDQVVPGSGMFYPGVVGKGIHVDKVHLGTLICYEGIFPEISQKYAKEGVDLLVNLTNDAWYGVSSGPYQHLAFYSFRAVETRKNLLRSTNTGITAVIDSSGRVGRRTELFKRTLIIADVPLLNERTVYSYIGDYPIRALALLWFYWLLRIVFSWKKIKFGVGKKS